MNAATTDKNRVLIVDDEPGNIKISFGGVIRRLTTLSIAPWYIYCQYQKLYAKGYGGSNSFAILCAEKLVSVSAVSTTPLLSKENGAIGCS